MTPALTQKVYEAIVKAGPAVSPEHVRAALATYDVVKAVSK